MEPSLLLFFFFRTYPSRQECKRLAPPREAGKGQKNKQVSKCHLMFFPINKLAFFKHIPVFFSSSPSLVTRTACSGW